MFTEKNTCITHDIVLEDEDQDGSNELQNEEDEKCKGILQRFQPRKGEGRGVERGEKKRQLRVEPTSSQLMLRLYVYIQFAEELRNTINERGTTAVLTIIRGGRHRAQAPRMPRHAITKMTIPAIKSRTAAEILFPVMTAYSLESTSPQIPIPMAAAPRIWENKVKAKHCHGFLAA